jgi:putative transposase
MKGMALPKLSTVKPKFVKIVQASDAAYPNLLKKQFNPTAPNLVWVSDITYIKINGGFAYVCVIIDLFARKLIAYKASLKADVSLSVETLQRAYVSRGMPSGVIFHSDRGVQYTAKEFRRALDTMNYTQSFSAKGHPYDNAVAEAFFKFLKLEETDRRKFRSLEELDLALFEYARFYNNSRPHSANDGITPDEREALFLN